ncbi:guanylate kinase [Luminiphilus syltensis NOR5-1B]|uniref:Guanylate kinase n=1 Tax=Luminiphilus syltensis NOR5-1B TaxID=565045 RepID=B8KUA4_9GAMM|nr:guanylate kinase [Luminiphilus syltensis]EED35815.1 guanylate kinase [Luminiphilus syltensis NOR5-1B]
MSAEGYKGRVITISAPSGAGKTSLVRAMVESDPGLAVSISHTTRMQRPGEQNGINYHFVDTDTFIRMRDNQELVEWAKVFDNFYGTSRQQVDAIQQSGKDVILEIDWQGARQMRQCQPDTCSIFILPPSRAALRDRLTGRGQDGAEVIDKRMSEATSEMSHYPEADYIVMNDNFDTALADLQAIVRAMRLEKASQGARLASTLRALVAD